MYTTATKLYIELFDIPKDAIIVDFDSTDENSHCIPTLKVSSIKRDNILVGIIKGFCAVVL